MLQEIVCGLPKFMFTTALPMICSTLITIRFFWRKCPVNTVSLAWMAAVSVLGNAYDLTVKGVDPVRALSVISPIVCMMILIYFERLEISEGEQN